MNIHKANISLAPTKQHFPCPALRNHVLVAVRHVKSWRKPVREKNKLIFLLSLFSSEMHTKLARIKNLANLNIGTDRPRSDAAENKGMKLIWGNRGFGLWAFQDRPPCIRFLIIASIGVSTGIPVFFTGIPVFR